MKKGNNLPGYAGKVLRVDLTRRRISHQRLPKQYVRQYLGGSGLSTRILFDELNPKAKPLTPENVLIFMTGPLTGTSAPCCGRYTVVSKSPLTGIWAEAGSGGFWGPTLKFSGFDGIIIKGKASKPVYLSIHDKQVDIRTAEHLWGSLTTDTERSIKKDLESEKAKVACIGPAGEKLSRIACIVNDRGRVAGRCGLGAVMGSKKLKAVAVAGTDDVRLADETKFSSTMKELIREVKASSSTVFSRKYGTAGYVESAEAIGDLPVKNWTLDSWPEAEQVSGQRISKTILKRPYACYRCPIACGKLVEIKSSAHEVVEGHGPEYETCASFGSMLLNDDLDSIVKANELSNQYGLDTISCGSAIAFAMECSEKDLLSPDSTDGLDLAWGNPETIVELVRRIGNREGIGFLLGEGVRIASKEFGPRSRQLALHVKGLELPMHDPRSYESVALGYATSNRGACHLAAASHWVEGGSLFPEIGIAESPDRFSTVGKAWMTAEMQNLMGMVDSLVLCKFALTRGFSITYITRLLSAATGLNLSVGDLMMIGERIFNLKRVFNNLCGIEKEDDALPRRLLQPTSSTAKWHTPNLKSTLPEYYKIRGWDESGRPTADKLHQLGLGDVSNTPKNK